MKKDFLSGFMPGIVFATLWVLCLYVFAVPQRIFNRIDYPIGTRLRLKRIEPIPAIPDTIQVVGYQRDRIQYHILSAYGPLTAQIGSHSNDDLHGYYLPLK